MKIAVDYDHTITTDKIMWINLISTMRKFGADVRIVTYREDAPDLKEGNQEVFDFANHCGIECIFTAGMQKKHMCENVGWIPDIWCDDQPEYIPSYDELTSMAEACRLHGDM